MLTSNALNTAPEKETSSFFNLQQAYAGIKSNLHQISDITRMVCNRQTSCIAGVSVYYAAEFSKECNTSAAKCLPPAEPEEKPGYQTSASIILSHLFNNRK